MVRVLALAGLSAAACAPEPTQILLVVSADGVELDALRIEAYGDGSPTHLVRDFDLTRPEYALPLSLTLLPSADTGPVLHVMVTGTRAGALVDERTATTSFVAERARRLEVRLGRQDQDGGVPASDAGDGGAPGADGAAPFTDGGAVEAARPELGTSGYADTPLRGPETTAPTVHDVCPAGSVLVGFDFSVEQGLVDGVHPHCGVPSLSEDGTSIVLAAGQTLSWQGGSNTPNAPSFCPAPQVVVGFDSRHGLLIDQVTVRCAPLELGAQHLVSVGLPSDLGPVGSYGGGADPTTTCGPGQVAAGVLTRTDSWLEGLGLVCTTVVAH